jgi:hypothetical protein
MNPCVDEESQGDFTQNPAKWGEDPNLVGSHVIFANNASTSHSSPTFSTLTIFSGQASLVANVACTQTRRASS